MQADGITTEVVRALALAQGVTIPEERLEAVRQQYRTYLSSVTKLDALPLAGDPDPGLLISPAATLRTSP